MKATNGPGRSQGSCVPALRAAGLLLGGATGALLLVALSVVARGGWSDFLETYVRNNLHYTAARLYPWRDFPGALDALVGDSWGFPYFYYACALLVERNLIANDELAKEVSRRAP